MAGQMEVDSSAGCVMASVGTAGSVSVSLHPLVVMNIAEHWTRIRAQDGKPGQGNRYHHSANHSMAFCLFNMLITASQILAQNVIFSHLIE